MPRRLTALAILAAVSAILAHAGQAPAAALRAKSPAVRVGPIPRTPDGHPDLQGGWDFRSATPLERPAAFAEQQVLDDQGVAAVEREAAERLRRDYTDDRLLNTAPWWLDYGTRVFATRQSSLIVDPPDGRFPPMTAVGARRPRQLLATRAAADDPEGLSAWDRCVTRGLPDAMLPGAQNNNLQIVQTPGHVVIVTEMIHEARIVPLETRAVPQNLRAWTGVSRGRWEGDTLRIDTSNFSERANFRGAGAGLRLVERLTRVDAVRIDYRLTVEDSSTWTGPWTVAFPLVKSEDRIYEYACHEANYSLRNILSAARSADSRRREP
jgi:hypothetical protein